MHRASQTFGNHLLRLAIHQWPARVTNLTGLGAISGFFYGFWALGETGPSWVFGKWICGFSKGPFGLVAGYITRTNIVIF